MCFPGERDLLLKRVWEQHQWQCERKRHSCELTRSLRRPRGTRGWQRSKNLFFLWKSTLQALNKFCAIFPRYFADSADVRQPRRRWPMLSNFQKEYEIISSMVNFQNEYEIISSIINQSKCFSLSLNKYALTTGAFSVLDKSITHFVLPHGMRPWLMLLLWLLWHNTTCCNDSFCKTIKFVRKTS